MSLNKKIDLEAIQNNILALNEVIIFQKECLSKMEEENVKLISAEEMINRQKKEIENLQKENNSLKNENNKLKNQNTRLAAEKELLSLELDNYIIQKDRKNCDLEILKRLALKEKQESDLIIKEYLKFEQQLKVKNEEYRKQAKELKEELSFNLKKHKKKTKALKLKYQSLFEKKETYNSLEIKYNEDRNQNKKQINITTPNTQIFLYDIIVNIDSLKNSNIGWDIHYAKSKSDLYDLDQKPLTIVGVVGRENIGKTFIFNKICGLDLPSGCNVNTKGLSLKYSEDHTTLWLDSAGLQTPVYYFEPKLLERFSITKKQLTQNEEIKREMINDRTITDLFIQDFILEVCEVIIIVVGQLSQNDQNFIERITMKYKAKKKIIIIHNFCNLYTIEDVENRIKQDIIKAFDTIERFIPNTDVLQYIEMAHDKNKEKISHLVLGVDWHESGKKYNSATFKYLQDILNTRIEKKEFDLIKELTNFFEINYRMYLHLKKKPKSIVTLSYDKKQSNLKIQTDEEYEISNPIFNSLGSLVTNPPYEVIAREDRYCVLIEIPDLDENSLKINLESKKMDYSCLSVKGMKRLSKFMDEDHNNVIRMRSYGEFSCLIPLGKNYISCEMNDWVKKFKYKHGIIYVEVPILINCEIIL